MPSTFLRLIFVFTAAAMACSTVQASRMIFVSNDISPAKVRYCFSSAWSLTLSGDTGYAIDNAVCPDVLQDLGGGSQVTTANQTVSCDVSLVNIDQHGQLTVEMEGDCIVGGPTDSLAMGAIMSNFGQSIQPAGTSMDLDGSGGVDTGDLEYLLP